MIRAVVFDFGGVIAEEGFLRGTEAYRYTKRQGP